MGSWSNFSNVSIILLTVVFTSTSASQTKIWINTVPGYSNLSTCAVYPLSTIVRDMERGCGDGGSLTSYTCFCTESSSHISTIIASDVLSQCGNQTGATSLASAQATSANLVFHAYCELGVDSGLSVTSLTVPAATSSTATPAASAVPTQTSATTSSSSRKSRTAAIAAGVVVPVVVIGLAAAGFLVWRAQKGKHQTPQNVELEEKKVHHEMSCSVTALADSSPVYELDDVLNVARKPVEMDGHAGGVSELGTD